MASDYDHAGVYITRMAGPARDDGGSRTLIQIWACEDHGEDPVTLTPAEATEIGMQLILAAAGSPAWKGRE